MAFEGMQGYDLINAVRAVDPVPAVREQEAQERLRTYGRIVAVETEFGCAEQVGDRWRILSLGALAPQQARRDLARQLDERAATEDGGPESSQLRGIARDLWAGCDGHEWPAAGRRYRIVRVDGFAMVGDDGPEPARHTDVEPLGGRCTVAGIWLDPMAPTTLTETSIRLELVNQRPPRESLCDGDWKGITEAIRRHPGVILLPVSFTALEHVSDGEWDPLVHADGPHAARQALAAFFRDELPGLPVPPEFESAARLIESETRAEFSADGYRFRIARIVRAIRVGPDGPEPPRPRDEG